jgi:predicted AAA+ superfamily ATPase
MGAFAMIQRESYMRQIRDFIDRPVIKVLTGMRRSGKSVLLELIRDELLRRGVAPENIVFINLESLRYERLKEYHALYEEISEKVSKVKGRLYLLLDEIQETKEWERAVNSFRVDFDCDIYLTGSNAKLFSGELATLLSGRYVEIKVYPLGFHEYMAFAEANPDEAGRSEKELFASYLQFGGLPGIHQMKWESDRLLLYLQDIYNSILLKDVVARNRVRDTALLEKIVVYLMDNIGNTFSAKTISDFLKSQGRKLSTETVYNYLAALESACLVHRVSRYDIKGKKLLETQEKYYLTDLGIRHAVMGYREQDVAGMLENVVFLELLRRRYTVYIGKQQEAEVDFVAERDGERLYIQVCYLLTEENMQREFTPLTRIQDNFEKVVLSMNEMPGRGYEGIKHKNVIRFLLEASDSIV